MLHDIAANGVRARDHSGARAGPWRALLPGAVAPSLAPLIERMFRYTWFLATEKRDAMVREGRGKEVDALVAEARTLQDSLRRSRVKSRPKVGGTGTPPSQE